MKTLPKTVLAVYLLTLLWLVLFKFSYDLSGVLLGHQARSLSLIPFAAYSQGNLREMVDNLVVFIPFGLLLGVVFKQTSFLRKLASIFIFSVAAEILQYIFAIGNTDTTDIIANTLGGLIGLALYSLGNKYIDAKKLDGFIVVAGAILLTTLILLRVFALKVRY
jgi:glycopeptide antibiotics resistance protein